MAIAAVLAAAAVAGPAPGAGEVTARARALVGPDPAALGFVVRVGAPDPRVRASTDLRRRVIVLRPRAGDLPHVVAHDLAHEVGHAYDHRRMRDGDRRAYLARRGAPGARWWPAGGDDYASGAGDFAEVFALCHAPSPVFRSRVAPYPSDPCGLLPAGARRLPGGGR
ncbi:MAG: hypothetical protein MUE51_13735 [Thermoleophilia bacterium]|jgi:hypothetical protein|nr:hypothetical protein [Thermoleophilia bacterium]